MAESTDDKKKDKPKLKRIRHGIAAFKWPLVRCHCGWVYRLEDPEEWQNASGKDMMLDAYNIHAKHAR